MFFCFKQKTAYEMRISDWSSDVCSSDLTAGCAGPVNSNKKQQQISNLERKTWRTGCPVRQEGKLHTRKQPRHRCPELFFGTDGALQIGRASCRARGFQYG